MIYFAALVPRPTPSREPRRLPPSLHVHGSGISRRVQSDLPIAIIGAGFAGIGTAIRLKQEGIHSFTMLERASEIGGTWRDNTYPGADCDVPSHAYSLSFAQNPGWTR